MPALNAGTPDPKQPTPSEPSNIWSSSPVESLSETADRVRALHQTVLQTGSFSVIVTDVNGIIQVFNVGAQRRLGYDEVDVINKVTPAIFADPVELTERAHELSVEFDTTITPGFDVISYQAAHGGEQVHHLTGVRKDGEHFPAIVSVTALRDATQQIIGFLLIGTDGTPRDEAVVQVKLDGQRRDRFFTRSVIESTVNALFTLSPEGVIMDVNECMTTLIGRTRDDLIGLPFRECLTEPAAAAAFNRRVLAEERVSDCRLTVRDGRGVTLEVSCNAVLYRDSNRDMRGIFVSMRGIHGRKVVHEPRKADPVAEVETPNMTKVAGELARPLTSIVKLSEILKDGILGELSDRQQTSADAIFQTGQHLVEMLNDLINLAHLQSGRVPLIVTDVYVESMLYLCLVRLREQSSNHTVGFDVTVSEEARCFPLDVSVTMQILSNVLSNAVRASDSGARVAVQARVVPRTKVGTMTESWPMKILPVEAPDSDEYLEISVQDAGTGIPTDQIPKMFDAFSSSHASPHGFENTGLGLAVVKELAQRYGGTVGIASARGDGTLFVVWLGRRPVTAPTGSETATDSGSTTLDTFVPPMSESAPVHPPKSLSPNLEFTDETLVEGILTRHLPEHSRIALVIESDARTTAWLRLLLTGEGYTVVHAPDGERGLKLASQLSISLITLDVLLPGIDGWGLLAQLRSWPELNKVPVVVIAGLVDMSFALSQGATAVLEKPITRADLRQSLNLLGLRTARARAINILVMDMNESTAKLVAAHLKPPHFQVAFLGSCAGAQAIALKLQPELIVVNLLMDNQTGFAVVRALQKDPVTACIPLLVMSGATLTREERDALQAHPEQPVHLIMTPEFNAVAFIAEIKNALSYRR